jgi:two-component system, OmpR family, alkaline phosphatase synthesis response regulator PhoP
MDRVNFGEPMRKVLVVEDDKDIAELVVERLIADGFRARSITNNREIWSNVTQWRPDVILLDIMMPGDDGLTILQRIRADPETKHIKVYMLTALNLMEDVERALELGADGYFTKPFAFKTISKKLWE